MRKRLYRTSSKTGGGVLTCWMIDHTDRFRAAASLYPVINWYSWVLTSDLPSFGAKYWFSGNPCDYTDDYMKRSVISLVKNVKTPTLLMTGEEDFLFVNRSAECAYRGLTSRCQRLLLCTIVKGCSRATINLARSSTLIKEI